MYAPKLTTYRITLAILLVIAVIAGIFAIELFPKRVQAATETRTYVANTTWVAPAGVTSVTVEAWAGGGGGGGTNASGIGGGGGAGGGYAKVTNFSVTPGNSYTVVVGQGGSGGTGTGDGSTGGDSMFSASSTLLAVGGPGGQSRINGGGGGATTTGSTAAGDTIFHGGNGGAGTGASGGGGGGAGDAQNGAQANNNTQGAGGSSGGGDGGAGVSGNSAGNPGSDFGGGGSGADSNNTNNRTGGTGGSGQMKLTYTIYTLLADSTDPGNTTLDPGDAATFAGAFTLQTSTTTDTITAAVVGLGSGAHNGIGLVEITNSAGTTVYGSVSNPSSATPSITLNTNTLTATTGATIYKIRITPKSEVAGGPYSVTAKIDSFTGTNTQSGSDTAGTTITINNSTTPGTPGTPTAGASGPGSLGFSWTAASGATSYKIERCTGAGCSDFSEIVSGHTSTSYTNSGLDNNTSYTYRVRGTNVVGDGDYSGTLTRVSQPGSPGTPSYSNVSDTTLTVSWTAPTGGATSYTIERCTGGNCDNVLLGDFDPIASGVTATSYDDSGLTANTTYYYAVTAIGTGGFASSDISSTSTGDEEEESAADPYVRVEGGVRLNGGVRLR